MNYISKLSLKHLQNSQQNLLRKSQRAPFPIKSYAEKIGKGKSTLGNQRHYTSICINQSTVSVECPFILKLLISIAFQLLGEVTLI